MDEQRDRRPRLVGAVARITLITISQALFNHFGIKTTTMLTDFSGYLIFVVAVVLTHR